MANSNGLITAPVSFADVKAVLGISSNDLSGLCRSNKINIMAKYKPVPYNGDTISQLDTSTNQWKSSATWFKGSNNNYGVTPYSSTSLSDVVSHTSGGTNGWTAIHPSGGASAPYRLHDFIYYADADGRYYITSPATASTSSKTVKVGLNGQGTWGLGMHTVLSGKYFGAAVVNTGNTTVRLQRTQSSPTPPCEVTFSDGIYFGTSGTFRIIPFMASKAITGNTPSGVVYYSVPFAFPNNIVITSTTPSSSAHISITNGTSKTCPAVTFRDINGNVLGSFIRENGNQTIDLIWVSGIVSKIVYMENNGPINYITIKAYDNSTVLLNKGRLSSAQGEIPLTTVFSTGDYNTYSRTLYVTFSDS